MNVHSTDIDGVLVIEPNVFHDSRGYFLEHYSKRKYSEAGVDYEFVQDNQSFSRKGVLRGLHYQLGHPQAKLVRVSHGTVFDVVVDVRRGSPTYKKVVWYRTIRKKQQTTLHPRGISARLLCLQRNSHSSIQVLRLLRTK